MLDIEDALDDSLGEAWNFRFDPIALNVSLSLLGEKGEKKKKGERERESVCVCVCVRVYMYANTTLVQNFWRHES